MRMRSSMTTSWPSNRSMGQMANSTMEHSYFKTVDVRNEEFKGAQRKPNLFRFSLKVKKIPSNSKFLNFTAVFLNFLVRTPSVNQRSGKMKRNKFIFPPMIL